MTLPPPPPRAWLRLSHARSYATRQVRLTKKQKAALERSRTLAETIARTPDASIAVPTVSLPNTETTDTLPPDVLLPYRPTRAPPLTSSIDRYTKEYTRAYARLDKAFVRDQLWGLWTRLSEGATDGTGDEVARGERNNLPFKAGKRQIIQSLLEEWGWPRVEQVERDRQVSQWRNTITEKDIPMTHAEAYLLLRRDPEFTHLLIAEHRVTLNMVVPSPGESSKGLSFRVKGKNHILQEIEAQIEARRKTIHVRRFGKGDVPTGYGELYQPISDISGAFLESSKTGDLVISYLDPGNRDTALALLRRAEGRLGALSGTRVLACTGEQEGAGEPTYAVYPYTSISLPIPSSTSSPLVTPSTTPLTPPPTTGSDWMFTGKNLFRVRRLGGWFGNVTAPPEETKVDLGRVLARDAQSRESRKSALLRDWLKESSALTSAQWDTHQYERHVAVQQGHLVYCTPDAQPAALTPPKPELHGDHSLETICRRLESSDMRPVFIPLSSVPMEADVRDTLPPRRVRRVRYRSTKVEDGWTSTVDFEVALPSPEAADASDPSSGSLGPVVRQTHRRSWHVMCPDSDRDLSIQEKVSRTLDLVSELPELRSIAELLAADAELGVMPLQLELGELGPYALDIDDTVISTGVVSKDAVSSLIETVESSRTFSSAGTAFKTMAALENLNSALRANRSAL